MWLALALAALGLWASLVPQITYPSASSGKPSGQGLVAWPNWFVQQDLGHLSGAVGRFRVWVSAKADGDRVTVQASLADATTGEVVRRTSFDTLPLTTRPQTVVFPGYVVPEGQRLLLQLQVAEYEDNYVVYQLAAPQSGYRNVKVNGLPDYADGPLALVHIEVGSGLRAAIVGDPSGRSRLVLAAICSVLAVLVPFARCGEACAKREPPCDTWPGELKAGDDFSWGLEASRTPVIHPRCWAAFSRCRGIRGRLRPCRSCIS